ncbi:MAG: LapA family protein [Alphaproteobacteria bacterium]|nr:LapA family protein [Alphaproteobacteria bacterium]MCD8519785.1 LapA family protein [Alphaproteobacteria bacterium]MCD8570340.1 LapA family protein [Alphaproteobacteria bacterium]
MVFLRAILGITAALVLVTFAVLNRAPVALIWAPFQPPYTVPLYAAILGSALFGFFWGALAVFLSHSRIRRERRAQKKELRRLEKELQTLMKPQIPGLHTEGRPLEW